jgi:hypothetical protein
MATTRSTTLSMISPTLPPPFHGVQLVEGHFDGFGFGVVEG